MEPDPIRRALTNSMLFYPEKGQSPTPDALGMEYRDLWLTAPDGVKTQTWMIPPSADELDLAVIFFHGNAGTMAHRLEFAQHLHRLGVWMVMAEYRGYGNCEGSPSESGLFADAETLLAEVKKQLPGKKIMLFGRSLGGAVAIDLASKHRVDALLVESTFTSLGDIAETTGIPLARQLVAYKFDSLAKIPSIKCPVLLIHGEKDEVIPFGMGEKLRDAAKNPSLEFVPIKHAHHNDVWLVGGVAYFRVLEKFIRRVAL